MQDVTSTGGFGSVDVMRRAFVRLLGISLCRYRELAGTFHERVTSGVPPKSQQPRYFSTNVLLEPAHEVFSVAEVNFEAARKDVLPFLRDPAAVAVWTPEFFRSLLPRLKTK